MLKNLGNQKGWQMSSLPYTWPHHTTTPYVEAYVFRSCWVTSNEAPQLHQKKGRFHHVPSSPKQCPWVFSWVFQASLMASCITSKFFLGVVPSDRKVNLSSTWSPKKSTMRDNVYCRLMLRCIWHPKKSATFVSPWDLWNSLCTFRSLTVAQRLRDTIKVQIFSARHPQYLSPYHCNSVGWFTRWFTLQWNGRSDDPAVNHKQPPSRLIFQLLPENSGGFVWEAINAGGQRAFVCQVPDGLVLGTNISSCSRTFTHTYICTYFACVCESQFWNGGYMSVLTVHVLSSVCAIRTFFRQNLILHMLTRNSSWNFHLFTCSHATCRSTKTGLERRRLEIRPLFLLCARPMKVEWKINPWPNDPRNHPTWCHQAGHSTDSQVWIVAKACGRYEQVRDPAHESKGLKSEKPDLVYLALKRWNCFRGVFR